jgi:hypothetical protein
VSGGTVPRLPVVTIDLFERYGADPWALALSSAIGIPFRTGFNGWCSRSRHAGLVHG